jgi:anti-sigma factor RsiW
MNTINHVVAPEEIMALLDGELSRSEAQTVSAHLERCAECAALADELRSTSQTLSRWSVEAVPEKMQAAIKSRADEAVIGKAASKSGFSYRTNFRHWRFWAIGAGGAAVAAVILAVFSPSAHHHSPPSALRMTSLEATNGALANPLPEQQRREQLASAASYFSAASSITGAGGVDKLEDGVVSASSPSPAPMIARSASLAIRVKDVDASRSTLDAVLARHGGYSAQLNVTRSENTAHALQASLRIPATELTSAIGDLKSMGSVENESQSGEEVTQQHTDLVARLKTARETEERLRSILQQRTGKISDVLEVEQEITRVRSEIESMEAEQKAMEHRVDFASVDLQLTEVYKAPLNSFDDSVGARIHNSFVAGYHNAKETLLGFLLFLEQYGPALLIWLVVLALPIILVWRRYRRVRSRL